ncbi:3-dehydroquinate dehydratase [Aquimixticola soesokkakensis]|uniref:3-dehydroquinate dehydratase n=1 Tax=Aquimixticola soesokkakensis TaxID=1519096 RepID=A0A1Y5TGK4_9RHOB|nr:type II 3-dehydroquinate dehydratase [Aquimixticola soesokkakensis]SLN63702.1 3-dehydroquinate dehydratase [Aquimixticola soesokkakensis]
MSNDPSLALPIYVINGPSLNLLGERQPHIYGTETLADIETICHDAARDAGTSVVFHQSNHEGVIIDWIHEARKKGSAILINPAGFTSTSIAILDALLTFDGPIFEVHISPLFKRDEFRHPSHISRAATAKIEGFGTIGYRFAILRAAALAA